MSRVADIRARWELRRFAEGKKHWHVERRGSATGSRWLPQLDEADKPAWYEEDSEALEAAHEDVMTLLGEVGRLQARLGLLEELDALVDEWDRQRPMGFTAAQRLRLALPAVRAWLTQGVRAGEDIVRGGDLARMHHDARNLATACRELGLIEPLAWQPSIEQRFFGVGGFLDIREVAKRPQIREFHAECWVYHVSAKGRDWLDALEEAAE